METALNEMKQLLLQSINNATLSPTATPSPSSSSAAPDPTSPSSASSSHHVPDQPTSIWNNPVKMNAVKSKVPLIIKGGSSSEKIPDNELENR